MEREGDVGEQEQRASALESDASTGTRTATTTSGASKCGDVFENIQGTIHVRLVVVVVAVVVHRWPTRQSEI